MSATNTDTNTDTNTATPTLEELQAEKARLVSALHKAREDAKAAKSAALAPVRKALGLDDNADLGAILRSIEDHTSAVGSLVAERTAALVQERDAAKAEAAKARDRWASDRIDHALAEALRESRIIPDFLQETVEHTRGMFEVTDDGRVLTRSDVPGVIGGATAAQFVLGQLRAMKPGLWPKSQGGGAVGGRHAPPLGDTSCFRSKNITAIARFADRYGVDAAIQQGRAHGLDVSWLKRGGGR